MQGLFAGHHAAQLDNHSRQYGVADDFLNLQVGDCIRLESRVDTDMNVYVGNIKKFTALPGTDRDSYAVQITSVIREEE